MEIEGVFAGLNTKLRKFKQEVGMEFTERVKARTPVKTGHLQNSWGITYKATDIEIYNTQDYCSFVEFGTPHMAPRAMLRTTIAEMDQICEVAAERAGLKK
jgi:HK97 gp10 family phage protein